MTQNIMHKNRVKKGFSLIELSIVIIIISVLITGSLTASVSAINNAKIKLTRDRMEQVYNALGNYLLINGHLPCPASIINKKSSDADYGKFAGAGGTAGVCNDLPGVYLSSSADDKLVYGMVPIRDLGLSNDMAEDGFGNKIAYIVDINFTEETSFRDTTESTDLTPMTVLENSGAGNHTDTEDGVIVLVSYGANKSGAFPANSASQNVSSTDVQELENEVGTISVVTSTATFDKNIYAKAINSEVYDDIVMYATRNKLITDFNAFSAVYCKAGNLSLTYGVSTKDYSFPQAAYDQLVPATAIVANECPLGYVSTAKYPTRKCGAFGVWQNFATNPCTE